MNKRSFMALFLLALFIAGSALALPHETFKALSVPLKEFDPEGQFNPIGDAPKGLEEVASFDLFRSGRNRPFTSHTHSGVVTTRGVVYRFKTISAVSQNSLTFTTATRQGTYYQFSGRFLKGGVFAELDSTVWDQPILEGTLTKYKNRKKVAESRMTFSYFGGT